MIIQTSGLIRDIVILMQIISAIKMVNIFMHPAKVIADKNAKFSHQTTYFSGRKSIHPQIITLMVETPGHKGLLL